MKILSISLTEDGERQIKELRKRMESNIKGRKIGMGRVVEIILEHYMKSKKWDKMSHFNKNEVGM